MRKVIIGVVFVMLIGAIGVGLVLGRVAEDVPLAASPTIGALDASPTAGLLTLPSVVAVQLSPTPAMNLVTNDLDENALLATDFISAKAGVFKDFSICYYELLNFVDGTSTITISNQSMIFIVDDKADEKFLTETGFFLIQGQGVRDTYEMEYVTAPFVPGYFSYRPVPEGVYNLLISHFTMDNVVIRDREMIIVDPPISLINDSFVMMMCESW